MSRTQERLRKLDEAGRRVRIAEILNELELAQLHYHETMGQHRAETAQFGDSWPGAQIELAEMRAEIAELEAELDVLGWEPPKPEPVYVPEYPEDDIPF